jgi:cytochrome c oxidase assembly factor CtaG
VGIGRVVDQQVAGLLMKLACGLILWTVITVILFRWASAERRDDMSNDFSSTGQW